MHLISLFFLSFTDVTTLNVTFKILSGLRSLLYSECLMKPKDESLTLDHEEKKQQCN